LFQVTVDQRGPWFVVGVVGELDLASAPELRQQLVRLINQGATRLIIDLRATDFIDSIGLGVIIGALKRLPPASGQLAVLCTTHRIRTVFEATRLDTIIPLYDDLDELVGADG
jgi:anti-sigma B factor antagonist